MKKYLLFALLSTSILFLACGPKYSPPTLYDTQQIEGYTLNKNFDTVWSALIEYISGSFFGIESFEKESGLLTLSFGSSDPSEFIDCGNVEVGNYNGPFVDVFDTFPAADSRLTGKMNLFVKKIGLNKTKIFVKSRYVFFANDGAVSQTWSFDTNGSDTKSMNALPSVTCKSTNKAEKTILEGIDIISLSNY